MRLFLSVILLGLFVSQTAIAVTSDAGTTAGKFTVANNGSAQYTVPIQVPPGINGMEPRLALVYNSQQGNGLVGVGWSLSGLTSIRRCPASIAVDGVRGGIKFNAERFCLNGQRLIEVARDTTTNSEYREYHTELESFSRIRAYGSNAINPTYFQVWTKDGRTLELGNTSGNTSNSNFSPQGGNTLVWSVNRIEDRSGNYLTVSYTPDAPNGEYLPSTISYTGNGAIAPARTVTFGYEARPDTHQQYVDGKLLTTSQRLQTVTTAFNSGTVRTYTLHYEQEPTGSARSRLKWVEDCGSDGICYKNSLTVDWRNEGATTYDNDSATNVALANGSEFGQWNRLVDMNGDGIQDVFSVTDPASGQVEVQFGLQGGGFAQGVPTSGVVTNSADGFNKWNELADVNGDGLVDIFRVFDPANGTIRVYLGKPNGQFDTDNYIEEQNAITYGTQGFRFWNQLIDMNGDGLFDIFRIKIENPANSYHPKYEVVLGKLDANGFDFDVAVPWSSNGTSDALGPYAVVSGGFRAANQLADMNGDGIVDIFRVTNKSTGTAHVLFGTGNLQSGGVGFVAATNDAAGVVTGENYGTPAGNYFNYFTQLVDVNGDSITDIAEMQIQYVDNGKNGIIVSGGNGQIVYDPTCGDGDYRCPYNLLEPEPTGTMIVHLGKGDGTFYALPAVDNIFQKTGSSSGVPESYTWACYPPDISGFADCPPTGYNTDSGVSYKGVTHWNQFADMNGDGYIDIVRTNPSGGAVSIVYSKGNGAFQAAVPAANVQATAASSLGFRAWNQLADIDGDGITDLFIVSSDGTSTTGEPWISSKQVPGKIETITSGLNLVTTVTYKPLTDSSVYTQSGDTTIDTFPVRKVRMPLSVVRSYSEGDGATFSYQHEFSYEDARVDVHRGWLGFAKVTKIDKRTDLNFPDIETTTTYEQLFPKTGRVHEVARSLAGGGVFERSTNSWASTKKQAGSTWAWGGTPCDDTGVSVCFVYNTQNVKTTYDIKNNYDTVLATTTGFADGDGDSVPYDPYGNPEKVEVTNNIDQKDIITGTTSVYDESSSLYPGQLNTRDVNVTYKMSQTPGDSKTRKTQSTYYDTDGLLQTETTQPISGDDGYDTHLTTTYAYDEFGYVENKKVQGLDAEFHDDGTLNGGTSVTREENFTHTGFDQDEWTVTHTSVTSGTNDLVETYTYSSLFGGKTSYSDPRQSYLNSSNDPNATDLASMTWSYDGFGRLKGETKYPGYTGSDASPITTTTAYSDSCAAGVTCAGSTRYVITTTTTGLSPRIVQQDALGREVRLVNYGAAGEAIYSDTLYNDTGRVWKTSAPYTGAPEWTEVSYDEIGRETGRVFPNTAQITYDYLGLATTVTRITGDEANQRTIYTQDSQGQIVTIQDALDSITSYVYGPFGVLEQVTGPDNVMDVYTFTYDVYGNKKTQNDPDMGEWSFRYNAFGDLKWQKDAKGQIITYQYDKVGRRTDRIEGTGGGTTTSWVYDNTAADKGIGLLDQVNRTADGGTSESYLYDGVGRVKSTTTVVASASYTTGTTYDSLDRTKTVTYPSNGLKIQYNYYDNNALQNIVDFNDSNVTYWSADTYNARGQVTDETWGNDLTGTRGYDDQTGLLTGINTGPSNSVQNLTYIYYKSGNLHKRINGLLGSSGVTETFTYDVLDRLHIAQSTLPTAVDQHYEYYPNGNIQSKTGVGTYSYDDPLHPHAVTGVDNNVAASPYSATDADNVIQNILNGTTSARDCDNDSAINIRDVMCINSHLPKSYSYDANGNMENGDGRDTVTYTLFNKPATLPASGVNTSFTYDYAFNRLTKTVEKRSETITTTYIGKLYEKIDTDGNNEERYYITALGRLVAQISNEGGSPVRHYVHTDMLGSVDAITDENQAVVERFSFDAFGMPRKVDQTAGAPLPPQLTTRGYTGHEMDDESGLINMNGRLYDPMLGRFMTPDPTIANVYNPQSLNRYSYVLNNPFRYTDPSGYTPIAGGPFDMSFEDFITASDQDQADTLAAFDGGAFTLPTEISAPSFSLADYTGVGEDFFQMTASPIDLVGATEIAGAPIGNVANSEKLPPTTSISGAPEQRGNSESVSTDIAGHRQVTPFTHYPEITKTMWERAYGPDRFPIKKIDLYEEPHYISVPGAGEALSTIVSILLEMRVVLDVQFKQYKYGEKELFRQYSVTTQYKVTLNGGDNEEESKILSIGPKTPTGHQKWVRTGVVTETRYPPQDVRVCPISCSAIPP